MSRNIPSLIQQNFASHQDLVRQTLEQLSSRIARAGQILVDCYAQGRKAIFLGNGGSAADAQHLAAEFLGRFLRERRPLPALALHANSSALTAIGNDYGYEQTFVRPLQALAVPGDVIVGISTSGNSRNVIAALAWARQLPCPTLALTGQGGGELARVADVLLDVPSRETPRIQEVHILLGHCLCEMVEMHLDSSDSA